MFCGISAFRSAAEKIGGFEFVGYCECDPTAIAAYQTLYDTRGEYFCNDARAMLIIVANENVAKIPNMRVVEIIDTLFT